LPFVFCSQAKRNCSGSETQATHSNLKENHVSMRFEQLLSLVSEYHSFSVSLECIQIEELISRPVYKTCLYFQVCTGLNPRQCAQCRIVRGMEYYSTKSKSSSHRILTRIIHSKKLTMSATTGLVTVERSDNEARHSTPYVIRQN